jgi:hypothetical protein
MPKDTNEKSGGMERVSSPEIFHGGDERKSIGGDSL